MAKSASGTGSWRYVKVHLEQFDRAGVIELIPLHDRKRGTTCLDAFGDLLKNQVLPSGSLNVAKEE